MVVGSAERGCEKQSVLVPTSRPGYGRFLELQRFMMMMVFCWVIQKPQMFLEIEAKSKRLLKALKVKVKVKSGCELFVLG